jgi:hypothetical protein
MRFDTGDTVKPCADLLSEKANIFDFQHQHPTASFCRFLFSAN